MYRDHVVALRFICAVIYYTSICACACVSAFWDDANLNIFQQWTLCSVCVFFVVLCCFASLFVLFVLNGVLYVLDEGGYDVFFFSTLHARTFKRVHAISIKRIEMEETKQ